MSADLPNGASVNTSHSDGGCLPCHQLTTGRAVDPVSYRPHDGTSELAPAIRTNQETLPLSDHTPFQDPAQHKPHPLDIEQFIHVEFCWLLTQLVLGGLRREEVEELVEERQALASHTRDKEHWSHSVERKTRDREFP